MQFNIADNKRIPRISANLEKRKRRKKFTLHVR